jgi:hypothetical protein
VPTFPKERFSGLTLFETTSASVWWYNIVWLNYHFQKEGNH